MNSRTPVTHPFTGDGWVLGVIGLGYVGLPLAVQASRRGIRVVGFDVDRLRVANLSAGHSHVEDVSSDELREAVERGVRFTTDEQALADADAVVIAVPSPLNRSRQPDMSYIRDAAATVARIARQGHLVVLESTTYPGTTDEVVVEAVRGAGLAVDEDVWVAFSPERVDPGNPLRTDEIPKVVGGVSERSTEVAAAAYGWLFDTVHVVSSARAAELTKLLENTYRAVNIALVNEMAQVAHALDIDIWEVIDAAATKPFGFQPFRPGPGVGGHCIPLDPQYLAHRAREMRVATRFIDLAEDINQHMPNWVVRRVVDELNRRGRALRGAAVLGVGLAYKAGVADDRESPAHEVLLQLTAGGATVGVIDEVVGPERIAERGYRPVPAGSELGEWQVAVVLTDHPDVDYAAIAEAVDVVLDCRGVYRRLGITSDRVVAL